MKPKVVLELRNVSFEVNGLEISKNITMKLNRRDSAVFLGMSGSGKTTLVKLCSGLYTPTSGDVIIDGENINKLGKKNRLDFLNDRVGFVFQDGALLSNMNIYDNIALPLRYHGRMKEKEVKQKVDKLISQFNLERVIYQMPATLSLGQKKLVSFARVMLKEPIITFYDEPTSSLDWESSNILAEKIRNYIILGGTAFSITHDMFFSNAIANKLGVLHDGELVEFDHPSKIKSSDNKTVKRIINSVSREADLADELLKLMN